MTIADLVIKIRADTGAAEKDMRSFGSKAQSVFGKALLPAVGVLGGLALAAVKTSAAASDLGESQNAVNVVFGEAAKKIGAFAKVADKEAGLSMRQLNQLVTPLGASFTNLGDSQDVAAKKSIALARRAADMASVFNTTVPEALEAIQAALRGESDPIEKFGVGLNDAAVTAAALAMGLAKTSKELTAGDKAQARYALLMKQTAKFQGDFANTSGEAANAARINAAAQENLSASLGKGLLPVVKTYQGVIASVTAWMAEHTGAVKIAAAVLGGLAVAVVLVNAGFLIYSTTLKAAKRASEMMTAASWLLKTAMLGIPLIVIIVALVALAAAIVVAWKRSETFRNVVTAAWNAIKSVTLVVFNFVKAHIGGAIDFIKAVASKTPLGMLITHFNDVRAKVTVAIGAVRSVVERVMAAIRSAVGSVAGVVNGVIGAFERLADAIRSLPSPGAILGKVGSLAGKLPGFANGVRNFGGGLAIVGERGPELVGLPRGSSVFSNRDSERMLAGRGEGRNAPLIGEVKVYNDVDVEVLARRVQRALAFA